MRLGEHRLLDAICAEYLLGTLRGGARRRFEAAVRAEVAVAQRLRYLEATATPRYSPAMEIAPPPQAWRRLERELDLGRYRPPWYQRAGFWQAWAAAATAALLVVIGLAVLRPQTGGVATVEIALLTGQGGTTQVSAQRSGDGRHLSLRANHPVLAGPNQSYELWLIPATGATPLALAVLGSLDVEIPLPPQAMERLRAGATLAISAEPAGGSPTGLPTGAVILAGAVTG